MSVSKMWTREQIIKFFKSITVEPALFLYMLSLGIYYVPSQALYVDKVCQVNFNYTFCHDLKNHPNEQIKVQKYVAAIQAYNTILQNLPEIIYLLLAGPWSDTNGRKAVLIFSGCGYVVNNGVLMINAYFFKQLRAEFLLFECLQDFMGGSNLFMMAAYAYISDLSTKDKRTKRFAMIEAISPLGWAAGAAVGGALQKHFGYVVTFGIGAGTCFLGVLYIACMVKDSRTIRDAKIVDPSKQGCKAIFDIGHIKDGFKTLIQKRPDHKRLVLWLTMIVFLSSHGIIMGRGSIEYLYYRKALKMSSAEFGVFTSVLGLSGSLFMYTFVPYLTHRFSDGKLLAAGLVCYIINDLIGAFAIYFYQLYGKLLVVGLATMVTTTSRSILSQQVDPMEIGKIFAVLGALSALIPNISSPFFTIVYNSTLATIPNFFLLFAICVWILCLILNIFIDFYLKK